MIRCSILFTVSDVMRNHRTWFFNSDCSWDSSTLRHSSKWRLLLRLVFNRLHNQPHIVRQAPVHPATDEKQRLNSHLSPDMANYTSVLSGPEGRRRLCFPGCMRQWGAGRPCPQDHLYLFLAKEAGMAQGWWNVCWTDRLWHLALVIFVTNCPPAYGAGHDCHNLVEQISSE